MFIKGFCENRKTSSYDVAVKTFKLTVAKTLKTDTKIIEAALVAIYKRK